MIRQTASSVIRQSMVQPDYKLTNNAKHPIGFPTQETTSIVEEQKESTNMDDPRTSSLSNMKKGTSTVSKESVDRYLDFLSKMYDPKGFTPINPEIADDSLMPIFVNESNQKGSGIETKTRSKNTFPKHRPYFTKT